MFLYNTALTVIEKTPGSHLELWRDFTQNVFQVLNEKEFLVWILLGKSSQSFIKNMTWKHDIIMAPHPAAEIYAGGRAGFFGSKVFEKCNVSLKDRGLQEIVW